MRLFFQCLVSTAVLATLMLFSTPAAADCIMFEAEHEIPNIPVIIKGRVLSSNQDAGELNACASESDCLYRADIQVLSVLKGTLRARRIALQYPYWAGCPGVDTFQTGSEQYFFLNSEGDLFGRSCGFSGSPTEGPTAEYIRKHYQESAAAK